MSWALVAVVVAFAACVQATVGFAYALLCASLLALMSPSLVPAPVLMTSVLLSTFLAYRERASVDWRGVGIALIGRVPGALLAGLAIGCLSPATYEVVFGGLVLTAVVLSMGRAGLSPTPRALLIAGLCSGFMGTLTAAGGPPMALVYQRAEGPTLRGTLNAYFALGGVVSLSVLARAGAFTIEHARVGLGMIPAVALGLACARPLRARVAGPRLRPAVLALVVASSLLVMGRALLR